MAMPFILIPSTGCEPVDEWLRLAVEVHGQGKFPQAEQYYRKALGFAPNHAIVTHNFAILLAHTGQLNEAVLTMERAALYDGVEPLIHANRAMMYLEAERLEDALAAAEYAVNLSPNPPPPGDELKRIGYLNSRLAMAMLSATSGYPEKALPAYRQMLAVEPKNQTAGPNSCFIQSLANVGPAELLAQRKVWHAANRYDKPIWPHGNVKDPNKVLRVGYVGGDFKSHSAAMMFSHVLLNHSAAVLAYFYCSLPVDYKADGTTAKFMLAAGHVKPNPEDGPEILTPETSRFRDISGKSDEDVDDMIRKDGIDILVDLAGHTNGGRLGVFLRKPAPVQVTAWGFAHGTGCPEIDYFFADPVAIPEADRKHYAEKIYDLPCIVTYRPPVEYGLKGTSSLPFWSNDYITFGSFSRYEKASDEFLACVREIMLALPTSRMVFKDHAMRRPYSIRRIRTALKDIDPARLTFGISTPHPDHMTSYQGVDVYLDTWPHGAGVVTLECLYQGVPLLTRYGPQPAGRTAASVLTAMGRTDWITYSAAEFVAKAVEWAGRPHDLAKARKTLREELLASPVVKGYPAAVEEAYRAIWREWCAKG